MFTTTSWFIRVNAKRRVYRRLAAEGGRRRRRHWTGRTVTAQRLLEAERFSRTTVSSHHRRGVVGEFVARGTFGVIVRTAVPRQLRTSDFAIYGIEIADSSHYVDCIVFHCVVAIDTHSFRRSLVELFCDDGCCL